MTSSSAAHGACPSRAYPATPPACNADAGVIGTFIGPSATAAGRPRLITTVSGRSPPSPASSPHVPPDDRIVIGQNGIVGSVSMGSAMIEGASAAEIVASVRSLVARDGLKDGAVLPPVRVLADQLGLNRNTVAAAYRQLAERGVVEGRGRGGTVVASPERLRGEGALSPVPATDLAGGNPDPDLLPDLRAAFGAVAYDPPLYGAPAVLPTLRERAGELFSGDVDEPYGLSVTHGALDAIERLLGSTLVRGDAVALEDPGYLACTESDRREHGRRAGSGATAGPGGISGCVRGRGRPPVARGPLGIRASPLVPHGTVGVGALDGQDPRPGPARRRGRQRSEDGGPAAAAPSRRRQLGQPSPAGHRGRAGRRPRHPAPPGPSACRIRAASSPAGSRAAPPRHRVSGTCRRLQRVGAAR